MEQQIIEIIVDENKQQLELFGPGVGAVNVMGAGDYSMRVWLNPETMRIRNITPQQVLTLSLLPAFSCSASKFCVASSVIMPACSSLTSALCARGQIAAHGHGTVRSPI